jgi:hypothetical protein
MSGVSLAGYEAEDDGAAAECRCQCVPLTSLQPEVCAVVSIADTFADSFDQGNSERAARRRLVGAAQANA